MSDINKKDKSIIQGHAVPSFIKDNQALLFVYKKMERLTAALHMVTDLIPPNEPIRIELRSKGLTTLSSILSLYKTSPEINTFTHVSLHIFEVISLLEIAHISGHISDMNHTVLSREYQNVLKILEQKKDILVPQQSSVTEAFFDVALTEPTLSDTLEEQDARLPGTPQVKEERLPREVKDTIKRTTQPRHRRTRISQSPSEGKKIERRTVILSLLRDRKRISVKDVASVITDCSEKTLQRELLAMVDENVLKKEGERRWSTYSLI